MTNPLNYDLVAISLYNESGNMLRPWAEAGYNCYCIDILNDNRSEEVGLGWLHYVQADILDPQTRLNIIQLRPRFMTGESPCTDLAALGAKHFAKKAEEDPEFQTKAMALFMKTPDIANEIGCPFLAENPIGRVSTLWRKPDFIFNPCDYGGYLPTDDVHPRWPQYIEPRDAYTKKTCLWVGNGFVMPPKLPVEPLVIEFESGNERGKVRGSKQWGKLGGKSDKTKQIRSETPRGFARATFIHNAVWHNLGWPKQTA